MSSARSRDNVTFVRTPRYRAVRLESQGWMAGDLLIWNNVQNGPPNVTDSGKIGLRLNFSERRQIVSSR